MLCQTDLGQSLPDLDFDRVRRAKPG